MLGGRNPNRISHLYIGFKVLPNPLKQVARAQKMSLGFPMAEFSPMEVSLWVSKPNPNLKDALILLSLSCASHILQIKIDMQWLSSVFLLVMSFYSMAWSYVLP